MLELPESYTIAKQMEETLKGKIISYVEVLHTPHKFAFFHGKVENCKDCLEGQRIIGATYHGGMIQLNTEDYMIVFADGARPQYYEDKKQFPKKHQFCLQFDDETALYVSIQMYGIIHVFLQGEDTEGYYVSSSTKITPLMEEFTLEHLKGLFQQENKKMSAKAFLATQQRIPGLGNGALQDILWDAGIDPRFPMQDMTEEDWEILYQSIKKRMQMMAEQGGRDTEKDLFGNKGSYITQLSKNSLYEPCMRCGQEIHKANYMGGTIYFCEGCQKK
ncbi:MAG: endonuclease VIII [Lachnospiraceae bacterium]|nr:endonuclease VIII [Lachnospiraceae bacterium]